MTPADLRIYGLIGNPVKHSLSPLMHNAAFSYLNLNAEYKLFEVKPQELRSFILTLQEKKIYGLNVTIPHKEKVMDFLDEISNEANLIGAVNTIKVADDRLEGFNTDGEGFLKHLTKELGFVPEGKTIAIIGAGGATRAISVHLAKRSPKAISIYDLDKPKAEALARHLEINFKDLEFRVSDSIEGLNIKECDLLVNATPIGMKETDPCLVDQNLLHKDMLVYDLIYNPKETKLLKTARLIGARGSNGLGMLLYQGAISFQIWTQRPAPFEIMRRALEEGVKYI